MHSGDILKSMIKIEVTHNIDEIRAKLNRVEQKKWPKILAYAANETGFYAQNKVYQEMQRVIDKPRPYTLRSLFVKRVSGKDPEATVMWRPGSMSGNSAGRYLMPLVTGGQRQEKGFEKLLRLARVIPQGYYLIPTKDAPDDGYGNVPGPYIVRILSFVRAFRDHLQNRNINPEKAKKKKLQYFIVQPGEKSNLAPGIYERISLFGGAIRCIFFFSKKAVYTQRFPFYDVASTAAKEKFNQKLDEGIKKAVDGEKGF
jgi:hypothetical protein